MKVPFGLAPGDGDSEMANFLFHNELEVLSTLDEKVKDAKMRLRLPLFSTRLPQPLHFNGSTSILSNVSPEIEELLLNQELKAMVIPLFQGGDLDELLREVGKGWRSLRDIDVYNLAIGILRALQAVNSASYVHLDLKPSNILLDSSRPIPGSDIGQPVLADFGLAFTIGSFVPAYWGASGYKAPELGTQELTGAEDVFSFGSLLYELSSRSPIGHEEMIQTQEEIWSAESPDPENLISRCWSQDPKQRPTLEDIIEELESAKRVACDF